MGASPPLFLRLMHKKGFIQTIKSIKKGLNQHETRNKLWLFQALSGHTNNWHSDWRISRFLEFSGMKDIS